MVYLIWPQSPGDLWLAHGLSGGEIPCKEQVLVDQGILDAWADEHDDYSDPPGVGFNCDGDPITMRVPEDKEPDP